MPPVPQTEGDYSKGFSCWSISAILRYYHVLVPGDPRQVTPFSMLQVPLLRSPLPVTSIARVPCLRKSPAVEGKLKTFSLRGTCCTESPFGHPDQDCNGNRGVDALHVVHLPFDHPLVPWHFWPVHVVLCKKELDRGWPVFLERGPGVLHEATARRRGGRALEGGSPDRAVCQLLNP